MEKEILKQSDEYIVERVMSGDDAAFDVLADRYREKLVHYVMRYTLSREGAYDVVQDALLKAHQKIGSFDTSRKFSSWMYRIAHNQAVDYIAKHQRQKTISLDEVVARHDERSLADIELTSLEKWFAQELKEQMHTAIALLPDAYAEVIHLRYIEELSYKEISDIIGKPVNTVGTLVRRAKKKLLTIVLASEKF